MTGIWIGLLVIVAICALIYGLWKLLDSDVWDDEDDEDPPVGYA